MPYTTQLDAARQGVITPQMEAVAAKEHLAPEALRALIAQGRVVIPANKNHTALDPHGIGQGLRTKINVNLGISRDCLNIDAELEKVRTAIAMNAEAIMDLSSYGKTQAFRQKLIAISPAMVGSVPMYDAVGFWDKELTSLSEDELLSVIARHAQDGVDFITVHAGFTRAIAQKVQNHERLTHIVSRGGSLLFAYMLQNDAENPLYARFDDILDICAQYDVTLSLGDACRPGSIHDATDAIQIAELITLGELTKRAWAKNVQVMIEGPGHMAIDQIEANVLLEKQLCHGAPFYVLGPLVTDIAPGYDHITAAIGGALAAAKGADFLCYVTPAEHLRLPDLDDMKEGIIAAKIAAHAGDLAKNTNGARQWDQQMSQARAELDWEKMFTLALDEAKPRRYRDQSTPTHTDTCTMCGQMCAVRTVKRVLNGEDVDLL